MRMKLLVGAFGVLAFVGAGPAYAQSFGTPVFNSLPDSTPANVPSLGFQCCATRELGDEIILEANTPRRAGSATVLMSSWAQHASYPALPAEGFAHPITLNIYEDAAAALAHAPVRSITKVFTIPWRPAANLSCPGSAWMSATDGLCYNGLAFEIEFDLRSLNYDLPSQFIYGVTFNTHASGYQPLGVAGPYDSLNIGFSTALSPSIGQDVDADVVYWNTTMAPWYTDGGAGGVGTFRADTGWSGLLVGVKFTTSAVPVTSSDCKHGGWQNLVRADFSAFVNQGSCVSYVNSQH